MANLSQEEQDGFSRVILINKPAGWTSFDVVAKIRSLLRKKLETRNSKLKNKSPKKIKVGHAGTLDPFATGLLIVLTGSKTKEQDKYMKLNKEYVATIKLGYNSSTGDPEGEIKKATAYKSEATEQEVEKALKIFIGEISQTPPAFSAVKINGKRAYELARSGQEVKLKPRKITILNLSIIDYQWPHLKIKVSCSSGTYIRTLAEEIGKELGCGAYLIALERTKIGNYKLSESQTIEEIGIDLS